MQALLWLPVLVAGLSGQGPRARPEEAALRRELRGLVPWRADAGRALRDSRRLRRPILLWRRGSYRAQAPDPVEDSLFAIVFTEPAVRGLATDSFVPLRLAVAPRLYTRGRAGRHPAPNPLSALGLDAADLKPPALVVLAPARGPAQRPRPGRELARLESLGTFDAGLVRAFLERALKAAGKKPPRGAASRPAAAASGPAAAARRALRAGDFARAERLLVEALGEDTPPPQARALRYLLGAVRRALGRPAAARRLFARLAREDPHDWIGLKARARLLWPAQLDTRECLRAPDPPPGRFARTERPVSEKELPALVARALAYLLATQLPDGGWPSAVAKYRLAISCFCAAALEETEVADERLEARRRAAAERAAAFLEGFLDADPETTDSFGAAYLLDYFVLRLREGRAERRTVARAVALLVGGQCPNGGWSYDRRFGTRWRGGFGGWPRTDKGRVHSMNTGLALLALARAKRAGIEVPADVLDAGIAALERMRFGPGVYTYTYPVPLSFHRPDQSIARGPLCEHALFLLDGVPRADLARALDTYARYRASLRVPVKLDKSWSAPHGLSCYFYFFAHFHAAEALRSLGGPKARRIARAIRREILRVPELDATWVDFPEVGKPYGTAAALRILHWTAQP